MNKRPIIGIPGWILKSEYFGVPLSYIRYASYWGIPRIIGIEEDYVDKDIDLLIIPGGADVNPVRYGKTPYYLTSNPDVIKEHFDLHILPLYIKNETPIFGICRGIQTLAVHFGATLVQHINHPYSKTRDDLAHAITLEDTDFKSRYIAENGNKKIEVNSLHHQCVSAFDFPEELEIIGTYQDKSVKESTIEVIKHKYYPIYGVQYHPEELGEDPLGDFIVRELLSCSKNSEEDVDDETFFKMLESKIK